MKCFLKTFMPVKYIMPFEVYNFKWVHTRKPTPFKKLSMLCKE